MRKSSSNRTVRNVSLSNGYQQKYDVPKSRRQWRISVFVRPMIYVIVAGVILYVIIVSPIFQIHNIKIKGNSVVAQSDIKRGIEDSLNSSPLSRNILFVNTNQLVSQLKQQNQQIAAVDISKQFPATLAVTVHEQAPSLLWRSGTQNYVVSDDGHAYSQTNQDNSNLIIVVDTSNVPISLGQAVVPAQFVEFVKSMKAKLSQLGIAPSQLSVGETTSEVTVTTDAGYSIRFDTTRSIDEQIADLQATLATLKKQNKKPTEYVDLRIYGKVFYK